MFDYEFVNATGFLRPDWLFVPEMISERSISQKPSRLFRYQGRDVEVAPQTGNYATEIYGFGSSPVKYTWKDLPREVLGEGIVLNASRNSATVFVTYSSAEIFPGDNAEIE